MQRKLFLYVAVCTALLTVTAPRVALPEAPDAATLALADSSMSRTELNFYNEGYRNGVADTAASAPAFSHFQTQPYQTFLPVPADPRDLHMHEHIAPVGLGSGLGYVNSTEAARVARAAGTNTAAATTATPDLQFRVSGTGLINMAYDTGPGSNLLMPATFASAANPASKTYTPNGQFNMTTTAANLKSDVQVPAGETPAQAFIDTDFSGAGVLVRHAYGRYEGTVAGKTWSAFCDPDALPQTIISDEAPAGAVSLQQATLQFNHIYDSGWMLGTAVEQPQTGDYATAAGTLTTGTAMQTFPDLVARVRYQPGEWGNVQVAGLFRELAYHENPDNETHLTPGWGISANACFLTWGYDNVRMGIVGGEGIGRYIFGLAGDKTSGGVLAENGPLQTAAGFGTYAAYEHYWSTSVWSTFAYGYADAQGTVLAPPSPLPAGTVAITRQTQNAWVNLEWAANDYVAVGLQYDYGIQTLQNCGVTSNQQIQLTLQLTATPKSGQASGGTGTKHRGFNVESPAAEEPTSGPYNRRL